MTRCRSPSTMSVTTAMEHSLARKMRVIKDFLRLTSSIYMFITSCASKKQLSARKLLTQANIQSHL
uniref:Uncharacterized protein MANES_01G016000 n=1 Tax=Rhizophora mucronata TaxID=61149 RepID=A0A2P2KU28_RHIMU